MTLSLRYLFPRASWRARFVHPLLPFSSLILQPAVCGSGTAARRHKSHA
ncbi:hypothetical protein [Luteolibacter luteus]|uniref:Uncharacterized protein n=1 Tax=Luteolibacter luteus TaxID=2728835 RepID=A0A858RN75_9BACT|nr:hypothetical protein [Luteolibacter luteus]QJE97610.1 hypothetical protein HHL09_18120 [Luteolibacter luteus]